MDVVDTGKSLKRTVNFPLYKWADHLQRATMANLEDAKEAATFLLRFTSMLWDRACVEGDVAIGFDIEWRAERRGAFVVSPSTDL